ncbi:WD40-repeat-containing domain protein [Neocallimastix lanati (nom. inval.)]|jgi:striatin 1/3/4|nr:WD40-repeat-containing domain protein [Neocallimastix sp. JGI-2020a]
MASDIFQQSSPNGITNYTFPGVLHYLQMEWRKFEKEKTEWEIERADLKTRLSFLEGERRGIENLKVDLMRRVKMLEYALRQERIKYLQLQQKVNKNESNTGSTENKPLTSNNNEDEIVSREIEKLENNDTKSDSISSNSNLLSRLNKESSKTQVKNKDSNTINPSPTPMSGNNLLLYSKGCGTLRSREILKAYLLEVGYWNPSSNNTSNMNDTRSFKHSNDSSSTVNSLNNVNIQKSIKTTVYTPINKDKSIKQSGANSLQNNNGNQGSVNKNNNSINGNSEYSIFMKKKMNGKRKEAPLSKLLFKASDDNEKEDVPPVENIESTENKDKKEVDKANVKVTSDTETNLEENHNTNNNNNNKVDNKNNDIKEDGDIFQPENVIPTKQLNKVLKSSKSKDKKCSIKGKKDSFTFEGEVYNFDGEEMSESLSKSVKHSDENKLWRPKLTLKNHLDTVRSLSFHHTDKLLLSSSDDGTAKLWNLEFLGNTKKNLIDVDPIYTYRGHIGPVLSVDISESVCYTGGLDSTVRSWRIPSKNIELYSKYDPTIKQHTFEGHTDAVWCVKSHPLREQYHLLASASSDGTIKLWDTKNYGLKSTLDYNGLLSDRSKEIESNPTYLDWLNNDLSKIIVSYQNSMVKLFDIETGNEFMKLPSAETYDNTPSTQINQVISHPTMPLIITAHEDRYIRFFDVKSGECINSMTAHLDGVTSLSVHPSGLTFASGGHDSSIRIWDIASKNCIQEMSSHRKKFDEGVWCVKYHPTLSNILSSGGGDSTCKIYSIDQPF